MKWKSILILGIIFILISISASAEDQIETVWEFFDDFSSDTGNFSCGTNSITGGVIDFTSSRLANGDACYIDLDSLYGGTMIGYDWNIEFDFKYDSTSGSYTPAFVGLSDVVTIASGGGTNLADMMAAYYQTTTNNRAVRAQSDSDADNLVQDGDTALDTAWFHVNMTYHYSNDTIGFNIDGTNYYVNLTANSVNLTDDTMRYAGLLDHYAEGGGTSTDGKVDNFRVRILNVTEAPTNIAPNITSLTVSNSLPIVTNDVIDMQFTVNDSDNDTLNITLEWFYSYDNSTFTNYGSDNETWLDQPNATWQGYTYHTGSAGDLEAADTLAWQYWYAQVNVSDGTNEVSENSSTFLIENTVPSIVFSGSGTTNSTPADKGDSIQFNVTGTDVESDTVTMKVCQDPGDTWSSCTLLCENSTGVTFDSVQNISITCDYVTTEDIRNNTGYAFLNDTGNITDSINISYYVNQYPLLENYTMQDTSGNQQYYFGEYIDYLRIDQDDNADGNSLDTYITLTDPDSDVKLNHELMQSVSGNTKGYETDIYLDAVGLWTVEIEVTDDDGAVTTYDTNFTVSSVSLDVSGRLYGYDLEGFYNYSTVNTTLEDYDYYFVEVRMNTSTDWSNVTYLLENMKNNSQIAVLTLWDDLSDQSGTLSYISDNFADLTGGNYLNAIRMIKLYIPQGTTVNAENTDIINNISKRIFQNVSNKFPIYVRNYNSSDLNSNYVTYDTHIYLNPQNQTELVEREIGYMRNRTTKSRFYYNLTTSMQSAALNWQNDIIDKFRASLVSPTIVDENVAELSNGDMVVVNFNDSTEEYEFSINPSDIGYDIYDLTIHRIIEQVNDGVISVNVSSGAGNILYVTNLTKIETDDDGDIFLYSVDTSDYPHTVDFASASANAFQFVTSSANAEDARLILTDPTYNEADFYIWYGQDGSEAIGSWSKYSISILADYSNAEWVGEIANISEVYGYVSVNDYGNNNNPVGCTPGVDCTDWNRTYWIENKESNITVWTDIQDNVHVFIDGLDIGAVNDVDGLFGEAMIELTDYVMVSIGRSAILNTYTSYEDYANLGNYTMRESACGRWDGTVSSPTYSYEDINLEVSRANFHRVHDLPVLAQTFGNITDYEKAYYCYMQSKVLYGDLMQYSFNQPTFEYTGAQDDFQWNIFKYPETGDALEDDYTVSGDEYSRRFEKGIVTVNTTAHTVDFDNSEAITQMEFCAFYYDNDDGASDEGYMHYVINDNLSKSFDVTDDDLTAFVKTWKCQNISTDYFEPSGFYELEFYYIDSDANYLNNNGLYMYHDTISGNDRLSFWDNTLNDHPVNDETDYTYYGTGDNWASNFTITAVKNASVIDQIDDVISRTTAGTEKLTVTYTGNEDWNLSIYDKKQFMNKTIFNGIFVNDTELNYENSSSCITNVPTFADTSVDGETWQACFYDSAGDGYYVKVVVPHLSTQNYTIDGNTPPTISGEDIRLQNLLYNNQTWVFNFTATDADNNTINNCKIDIDGNTFTSSPSGNDCSIEFNYTLNGTQFTVYPYVDDEYATDSTDGENKTIANISYDGISSSTTTGTLELQYFLKYWNITQSIDDFTGISWSYDNLTARSIDLTNGSTNEYLDYTTNLILTTDYNFTPDGSDEYTVDAGEEVFRYFNVSGNLSTGEAVPEFNITMDMENYVSGAQSMNHVCDTYDPYGSGNYTTGSAFEATIQSVADSSTGCYQYVYAGKIIYSNATLNSSTSGNTKTYFFSDPDGTGYGYQINYMFSSLRTSPIDLTLTLPYSDLTDWTDRETSAYDVYRFSSPATYTEETVTVDYTYEDNQGSEFVQFNWPTTNTPFNKQYVNISWTTLVTTYQCNDGVDNDGDGNIDYPADAGCSSETDDSENSDQEQGGGGGGGATPLTVTDTSGCQIEIDPQIVRFNADGIETVTIYNGGSDSYNPSVSITGDLKDLVDIVNPIFPLLPKKSGDMGVRYSSEIFTEGEATIVLTDDICGEMTILVRATETLEVVTIIDTLFTESEGIWSFLTEPVFGVEKKDLRDKTKYLNFGVAWLLVALFGLWLLYNPISSAMKREEYLKVFIWSGFLGVVSFVVTVFLIAGVRLS